MSAAKCSKLLERILSDTLFPLKKSTYRWEAGARRSDTRPNQRAKIDLVHYFCHI
ncbi:hypothetical protein HYV57_00740 [Candidatus Peregrinibacteria bacterium]|nr:hypothetical protein [Candidatus Peregrinibacteria bacterium]